MDRYKKEVFNGQINKGQCKVMGEHKEIWKLVSSPTLVMHQFREARLCCGYKLTPRIPVAQEHTNTRKVYFLLTMHFAAA